MLTFKRNPLAEAENQELRKLPSLNAYQLLRRSIMARAHEQAAESVNAILESENFDGMTAKALKKASDANKYQTALDVLKELEAEQNHYSGDIVSNPNP